uniref:Uncharacterized protein n=1 Tax=Tetradesmus obliquus TaxID=3088 RepID=A0A383W6F4_TETOB|eukprot:jgi/Sobl393_1/16514/SZX72773.1
MEIDLTDEQHEQQQEQPAAAPNRQQLADAGQEQLLLLLQSSKALLDAYSGIQPTTECQQKLAELQQAYLAVSQDIRDTLQQCQALEQQEAAAAATAAEAAGAGGQHALPPEQQQQLEARAAELRARLCHQNSLVKQVIDKLRHLVDAFNMWDSHERHLVQNSVQYALAGTGAI